MSKARTSPRALARIFARRRARGDVEEAVRKVFAPRRSASAAEVRKGTRLWLAWRRTLRLLRPLGRLSDGNRIQVLCEGDAAFEAMWSAIASATTSVLQSTYIFEPDRVGTRTLELLTEAARRGCAVTLVYDSFGSSKLTDAHLEPLRSAGARVLVYNPMLRGPWKRSRLVRNHQKILVVDGQVGFCGGMNVAEDYAGPKYGTAVFRDTHLRLSGPSALDLARLVGTVVHEVTDGGLRLPEPAPPEPGGSLVQILESNVRREHRAIQKALRTTIARSIERCWLTSSYFVPPRRLVRVLRHAARRGVDVRVLTAGRSDVPIVGRASRHLYGRLLSRGVRIFEMQKRTLHAKTAVIDGVYASIGSFNLDYWSDRRNLEVNVSALDRTLAREIEREFERDLLLSEEVLLEHWRRRNPLTRLLDWLAYHALRL